MAVSIGAATEYSCRENMRILHGPRSDWIPIHHDMVLAIRVDVAAYQSRVNHLSEPPMIWKQLRTVRGHSIIRALGFSAIYPPGRIRSGDVAADFCVH